MDTQKEAIEQLVTDLVEDTDMFMVKCTVSSAKKVMVYLDADSGLSIDKCVKMNRAIYKDIVENGIFEDGEFALDVSSPGVDEPLVMRRQFNKNIGRKIEITKQDNAKVEGRLKSIVGESIIIEQVIMKENLDSEIPFEDIKEAKILIEYK